MSLRVSYSIDGIGHVLDGVVAAALVAVADAAADHIDCPLCGLAGGEHDADDECPLARLAAALGVSR